MDVPPDAAGAVTRVGLDVGGTKILGVVLDRRGEVTRALLRPTPQDRDEVVATLGTLLTDLLAPADPADDDAGGAGDPGTVTVGIGVPGAVDRAGRVVTAPNVPALRGLVASELAEALGHQVAVDNDANCAALAEWRLGVGREVDDLLLVTLGTGIGGGIVAGGRLLRGAGGLAAEIGHLVVERDGRPCPCGQRGCWEQYASGTALGRLAREAAADGRWRPDDPDASPSRALVRAVRGGDHDAGAVLDVWVDEVVTGLIGLLNLLDPAVVAFSGGVVNDADLLLPLLAARLDARWAAPNQRPAPRLTAAVGGHRAGAVGAALLPEDQLDNLPAG